MNTSRVTIMLDDQLAELLRREQIKKLGKENRSVSFSEVINDAIRKGLKK